MLINFIEEDIGSRLDKSLTHHVKLQSPDISRSKIQKLIKSGMVSINNKIETNIRYILEEKVSCNLILDTDTNKEELEEYQLKLDIIYQDNDLAVINKPIGLITHPTSAKQKETLANALLYNFKKISNRGGVFRPGIVHRLDKNTSGLIIIAKNNTAHINLSNQIQERRCKRFYLAFLWGGIISNFWLYRDIFMQR